jgi:hypothetical protein
MNQAKTTTKTFTFVYKTNWTEEKLLKVFVKELKKLPCFYLKKKPKTFDDLNFHFQNEMGFFGFEEKASRFRYPLFLPIAFALEFSYNKHRKLYANEGLFVIFKASWKFPLYSGPRDLCPLTLTEAEQNKRRETYYREDYEMPFNDKLKWFDLLEPQDKPWHKYMAKRTTSIFI